MSAYSIFKETVLALATRSSTTFTTAGTSIDMVLVAMNNARRQAQREYAFNLNRTRAFAQLSIAPTSILTDFDADPTGAGATVVVKQIDNVYEYSSATVSGTTRYYPLNWVPFVRYSMLRTELGLAPSTFGSNTTVVGQLQSATQMTYQQGVNVMHTTLTTPAWYMFDVIEWLPDHDGGAGTDIFFTYFQDWLQYATLLHMNQFLKDGERFQFDQTFFQKLWDGVKQFDSQAGASTDSITLD